MALKTQTIDPRLVRADADETEEEKKEREDAAEKALSTTIPDAKAIMDAISGCMDALKSTNDRMDAMEARRDKRKDGEDEDEEKKKKDAAEAERTAADKRKDEDEDEEKKKEREDAERKDAERAEADKKRKDAEDKEKAEKEREDAARPDSVPALQSKVKSMEDTIKTLLARSPEPLAVEDARLVAEAQARADGFLSQMGQHAPRPFTGEDAMTYRRRVLRDLRQNSPALADVNLYGITDEKGFAVVEERIYADSIKAFNDPANIPAGKLIPIETQRDGHTFREYRGESRTWMDPMGGAATHRVTGTWGG